MQARNTIGVPFTRDYMSLMEARCVTLVAKFKEDFKDVEQVDAIDELAPLLLFGEVGEALYDLILCFTEATSPNFVKNCITIAERITSKIKIFDFTNECRKIMLSEQKLISEDTVPILYAMDFFDNIIRIRIFKRS